MLIVKSLHIIFMVAWFAGALLSETERFLEWEKQQARTIPGYAVPR